MQEFGVEVKHKFAKESDKVNYYLKSTMEGRIGLKAACM